MPGKKSAKRTHTNNEQVLDSFESWLKHQKPKQVKAKTGFISEPAEKS
jgi:hypothetical protein